MSSGVVDVSRQRTLSVIGEGKSFLGPTDSLSIELTNN